MKQAEVTKRFTLIKILAGAVAVAFLAAATLTVAPRKADANPGFASATGKPCATCHTAPPALNGTGKKFKAKGYKF